jgi:hypothetical protein
MKRRVRVTSRRKHFERANLQQRIVQVIAEKLHEDCYEVKSVNGLRLKIRRFVDNDELWEGVTETLKAAKRIEKLVDIEIY